MDSKGVLMTYPMNAYLEEQLSKHYNLYKLWTVQDRSDYLANHGPSIHAIVGNLYEGASAALIDALPNLEIVATFSAGVDRIDVEKCKERSIRVVNTPAAPTVDVADLAIALILAVLRKVVECDRFVRAGLWKKGEFPLATRFTGKRVGIIGLGRIGSTIARRAEAFDCPISYHSRTKKEDSNYTYYPTVVELASNSDILVVSCALTAETRHIVNREVLNALGPEGILINVGRGPHVDEQELISALTEGQVGGAGLDVYENEPHVPEELFKFDNVVLMAHVGTKETRQAKADIVLGNLEAHFNGKPLLSPVL